MSDRTRGKGTTKSAMKGRYRECKKVSERTKGKVRLCKEKRLTECKTVSDRRARQWVTEQEGRVRKKSEKEE